MAKITRVYQRQFGLNGTTTDFGQFGSLGQGAAVTTKDADAIQNGAAFAVGWTAETVADNRPSLEDFNGLDLLTFQQLAYIFQEGVPEWDSRTEYFVGSIVNDGTGVLYKSTVNSNTGNAVTDGTKWSPVVGAVTTTITGEVRMWAGTIATIPTGWLMCDGSVVSQTTYAALYAVIGSQYNTGGEGAGNFRLPDMRNYYPVGARIDDGGAAKSDANNTDGTSGGSPVLAKTRANNNWWYAARSNVQSGPDGQVAGVGWNGHGDTNVNEAAQAYPNYVAFAFMIKY